MGMRKAGRAETKARSRYSSSKSERFQLLIKEGDLVELVRNNDAQGESEPERSVEEEEELSPSLAREGLRKTIGDGSLEITAGVKNDGKDAEKGEEIRDEGGRIRHGVEGLRKTIGDGSLEITAGVKNDGKDAEKGEEIRDEGGRIRHGVVWICDLTHC
ncbi:hypothetical protein Bca4012_002990 [Brassica carinata]